MATDNISILKIEFHGEHLEEDRLHFTNRCEAGVWNLCESVFQNFLLKGIEWIYGFECGKVVKLFVCCGLTDLGSGLFYF